MTVRIGVDVGGTFTKAVGCDASSGELVGQVVVPTSHGAEEGVGRGVVEALAALVTQLRAEAIGPVALVAHSTTQAVNALLEGDTSVVGILGIGRRPDLRRAHKRTHVGELRLAPNRRLQTRHAFVDASEGIDRLHIEQSIDELLERGTEALCISEAFGVEDPRGEWLALDIAASKGIPACAGHELSGLYGLEMRTVTAALNASILPTALTTASMVERAIARDVPGVPLLVMRGDGGAADLTSMRRHPILTAFSGPAASVAGALHHLAFADGVVVEVGGTSTNVSTVKGGRPVLAYVRVLDHVTSVRSVDVRVVGVAGGSLLRFRRSIGRLRFEDVGPRSAHVGGLPYCSFSEPDALVNAEAQLIAPRRGDPAEYAVLEAKDGSRFALTLTCAANALGEVAPRSYAVAARDSAVLGFQALGRATGRPWEELAKRTLEIAAAKVAAVVAEAVAEQRFERPPIVGLGGGAGALIPALGQLTRLPWNIPAHSEVISSIGDALSLIRIELERTLSDPTPQAVARLHHDAELAAVAAGAAPDTVQLESKRVPERRALRVVALGAVALRADSRNVAEVDDRGRQQVAQQALQEQAELVVTTDFYSVFAGGEGEERKFAVVDSRGTLAASGKGVIIEGRGDEVAAILAERLPKMVRHLGPMTIAPALRVLRGSRLVDLSVLPTTGKALEAALAECDVANGRVVAFVTRD